MTYRRNYAKSRKIERLKNFFVFNTVLLALSQINPTAVRRRMNPFVFLCLHSFNSPVFHWWPVGWGNMAAEILGLYAIQTKYPLPQIDRGYFTWNNNSAEQINIDQQWVKICSSRQLYFQFWRHQRTTPVRTSTTKPKLSDRKKDASWLRDLRL